MYDQTEVTALRPRARPGTKQAEKADETRRQLLEATILCLAEDGFSNTTMTSISRRAKISRGAMQYHFESMLDLLKATAEYIQQGRLDQLGTLADRFDTAPDHPDRFVHRVDDLWRFVRSPASIAFFELSVASRTDETLAAVMRPAHEHFRREWVRTALEAFPEWKGRPLELELACSFAQTLLEGLAMREITHQSDPAVTEALRGYLADRISDIFDLGDRHAVKLHP